MLRRHLCTPITKKTSSIAAGSFPFLSISSRSSVNFVNEPSKNNPNMKHLDIYARRDPQLAPYLLREVDIEYKRKCRKVNFVFWWSLLVTLLLLQSRESLETAFYLKHYTELLREELDAKDDDMDLRRAKMVQLVQLMRGVERRAFELAEKANGKLSESQMKTSLFGAAEMKEAETILRSTVIPEGQRKVQEGTKEYKDMDLTGMGNKSELYSRKGASA